MWNKAMGRLTACLLILMPGIVHAANVGSGYGESLLVMTTARQAGTGGLALEDPWRQGTQVELGSILMSPGLRWFGLAGQGGIGPGLRGTAEVFTYQSPGSPRTSEMSDGSYGGGSGTVGVGEWAGRGTLLWTFISEGVWRAAVLGRATGLMQRLPDEANVGGALDAGCQAQYLVDTRRALTVWGLVGPLGYGGGRMSVWRVTAGTGWLERIETVPILGRPGGYGAGIEGEGLGEGLLHYGLGALCWLGSPSGEGMTVFLRTGLRFMSGSAQEVQPRGGAGVLWSFSERLGMQFDYAVAPMGALGTCNYATLGVRMLK